MMRYHDLRGHVDHRCSWLLMAVTRMFWCRGGNWPKQEDINVHARLYQLLKMWSETNQSLKMVSTCSNTHTLTLTHVQQSFPADQPLHSRQKCWAHWAHSSLDLLQVFWIKHNLIFWVLDWSWVSSRFNRLELAQIILCNSPDFSHTVSLNLFTCYTFWGGGCKRQNISPHTWVKVQ